MKDFQMVLVEW
jgi:hypothetical protein